MDKLLSKINIKSEQFLMIAFSAILISSIFLAIRYYMHILIVLPAGFLIVFLCIVDFKKVFYLLMLTLPISIEVFLPGGLGTDLPSEPLMVGLMGVYFLYFLKNLASFRIDFYRHAISLALLLHFLWILITAITSADLIVSVKFLMAKTWYISTFFLMTGLICNTPKAIRTLIWCVAIPLTLTIIYGIVNHAATGFAFDRINPSIWPFYRNHVNYAALLTLFFPFVWFLRMEYKRYSRPWTLLWFMTFIILIGITLSYTRAAYLALIGAIGFYYIVKFRLIKLFLTGALVGSLFLTTHLLVDNNYLNYAPDFEKTIAHKNFNNLVEATAKGEDVSVMERFYRWIAGVYMIKEKPVFGFGPGNFYFFYKSYTIDNFETYVSDNPEKSGIHSYYLMLGVEQGIPGIIIFVFLLFVFFYQGEKIYHQTRDSFMARTVMSSMMSIVVIIILLIINDLIETDKVGSFFFICLALVINVDIYNRKTAKTKPESIIDILDSPSDTSAGNN